MRMSAAGKVSVEPETAWPGWLAPFEPISILRNAHLQTLAGNFWRREPFVLRPEAEAVEVDPADGSRVLCHCHWQAETLRAERLTLVLVHGLEGSSDSRYIRGITARAWIAGCNVVRMNMRNCGGTDTWTPSLYHSGLSGDVDAVLRHFRSRFGLRRMAMVGYSMGGNLVLKLAGDLGSAAPDWLLAAVAVSPAADLAPSADALHEPQNWLYERNFLRNLTRRFQRKVSLFPERYGNHDIEKVHSIREFDDRITARFSGFAGADDYYFRSSASQVVSRVAIPTLVINALDDPFIRLLPETRNRMRRNPAITIVETERGGHCAFLARKQPESHENDRHWAEATLLRFLLETAGVDDGG